LKFEILGYLGTDNNAREIIDELSYYATISDVDVGTSRKAVKTIGEIAIRVSSITENTITLLLDFLDAKSDHLMIEIFIVMKDILRKYNNDDFCRIFLPVIVKHWIPINEEKSTVSFLWILGEYGQMIDSAPYLLEEYIENYKKHPPMVKSEILSSTVKLFFKRAPEVQKMLGLLFETSLQDYSNADVHDKALYYYRLLKSDLQFAKKIVNYKKTLITSFTEEDSTEFRDKLSAEFNTLSIPFHQPSDSFIVKNVKVLGELTMNEKDESSEEEESEEDEESEEEDEEGTNQISLLGGGIKKLDPFSEESAGIKLQIPQPILTKQFSTFWKSIKDDLPIQFKVSNLKTSEEIEAKLKSRKVICIASTKTDPLKFYFYAQTTSGVYFFIEAKISLTSQNGSAIIKSESKNQEEWQQMKIFFLDSFNK
jgi:AP-4 complex subunit beta-1